MSPPGFSARLDFSPGLEFFLRGRGGSSRAKLLREKTSVKDVIESCGVPHPEVDLILANNSAVNFAFQIETAMELQVFGVGETPTAFPDSRLQPIHAIRFVADGHLAKMARQLRSLGIDVVCELAADDRRLLAIATTEERALLTRDRQLLMHGSVGAAYYPRSQKAEEQVAEAVRRFHLQETLAPFTRCARCNAPLVPVPKAEILSQLEPLTRIYYNDFRRCTGCGQIYWSGTHFPKLKARLARLRAKF